MSKALDPRDNYGPPKNTNKTLALGTPSYLNKITASHQPITSIRPQTGIRPSLVTPSSFTSKITNPSSSSNTRPSKLAYYSPPDTLP
ncbi:hypothetical protein A2U01_0069971, partial [Trifolium medium]|nr:hypothetical protein [Trifolium medium]